MLPCSIRARLLGLVVAAIVPFMLLTGIGLWNQWRSEHAAAIQRALNEARLIAAQVDDHIGNLDNLLMGLSRAVSTNSADTKANDALLRQIKSQLPDFVSHIVLLSLHGHSIGTSLDAGGVPIYAGDRSYFQKMIAGERLSIGEVIRGRVTGKWIINVARPVEDQAGRLRGVLTIGTWLERFQDALRLDSLPAGSIIRIVNENGIVIAQSVNGPNWIGRDLSKFEHVARHITAREASEVTRWSDDVDRITGSSTAHRAPWLVSVGLPSNIALAAVASRLGWGALFSTIALMAAFMVAWTLSGRIVRPIQQLGKDASMLAAGELGHRSVIRAQDEVGDLATSFNLMAESLEQRHEEAKRSSDEIRQAKDALAALIENAPVPIVVKELKALQFILVNQAYEKFMGISRAELIGKTAYDLFPPDDADKVVEYDKRALQLDERIISGEFQVHTPNNGVRIVTTTRLVVRGTDNTVQHLMAVIEDVTDRKRADEQIFHLAHHDALTGLPNRVQYYERLDQELKRVGRGEHLAVLCLDLDHFKNINDTLGHSIGDELLMTVTDRLRGCVRETDTIARLGGDEFAIIQTAIERPLDASTLADRIQEAMRVPFDLDGLQAVTNVSIGISLAPTNAITPNELMKQADMALYRAKAAGRNTYRFFEPEMDASMKARRRIESDLRNAVVNGGLELHYQPVVDLQDNVIVGMEALVRWRHLERGMLSPVEFISVAEETGLIVPLGEWVLRQACSDAAKWPGDIKVAVNLSPAQFKDRNLMQVVIAALAASALSPRRLELEITEELLLQDDDNTLARLHQLRELGVQIVMDDFGTGYSSLNYLRRFPLDKIKIDQAFIGDLSDGNEVSMAIVQAVVGLAKVLKARTTAEGVETEEQLTLVRAAGCTEMQGYLFSPPRPVEELLPLFPRSTDRRASAA
jgi:diguanylate cyclase (GGDEF)-like protein/PAS domain S-box-containing protein